MDARNKIEQWLRSRPGKAEGQSIRFPCELHRLELVATLIPHQKQKCSVYWFTLKGMGGWEKKKRSQRSTDTHGHTDNCARIRGWHRVVCGCWPGECRWDERSGLYTQAQVLPVPVLGLEECLVLVSQSVVWAPRASSSKIFLPPLLGCFFRSFPTIFNFSFVELHFWGI